MSRKSLRNTVGIASLTALALTMVACGGSSTPPPAPVNQAPTGVVINGATAGKVGHLQIFTLSATDPEGDAITFSLTTPVAGASISGNILSFTPAAAGTVVIGVTATATGGTATGQTAVLVAANQAPTFLIGATLSVPFGNTTQSYPVGNAADADGDTATYSLAAGAPAWVTYTAATRTLTVNPTGIAAGTTVQITLNATDGLTGGAATPLVVSIVVGAAPVGTLTGYPSNTTVIYRGLPFQYQFAAGSPLAGDTIIGWSLDNGSGGAVPLNASITAAGMFTWTPSATIALGDPVFFGVKATFASGVVAYQPFQLTPTMSNSAPVWNAATSFVSPTKLNGTTDATLASTFGAVLSWAGSTANSYTVPVAAITTTDVDITATSDADTFTVTKAVIVGDATATDVTAQITAAGGSLSFVPGTLTGNVYAAGTLTFVAPTTGIVKVGAVNLGQATTTSFVAGTTGNLKVTITATDKGGLTSTHVVEIPVRRNTAPVIDTVVAGGAAVTSGDDYPTFASAAPAFGIANTWTLNAVGGAPALKQVNDLESDTITQITLSNVTVNGVADTRFSGAATPTAAPTQLVVSGPSFIAADSRKPYSFSVTAADKFGAMSKTVTFSGLINGTVTGTEVANWVSDADPVALPYDFTGANTVTINPYYPTGIAANIKKFNTDLGAPVNYVFTGDAAGNFSINSVPGGVYYAKTNVTTTLPTAWYAYSTASSLNLNNADAGRVSPLAVIADPLNIAVASTAGTTINPHFGLVSVFDLANDAFQAINTNLGLVAFTSSTTASSFPGAWAPTAVAPVTIWTTTNNLADLDYQVDWFTGNGTTTGTPLVQATKGDKLVFGRMTRAIGTDAAGNATSTNFWKLARIATPAPAPTMVAAGPNAMNANFGNGTADGVDITMGSTVKVAITRSAFNANLQAFGSLVATLPVYTGDLFKVVAYPHGTANGAIEPGVPVLFQLADLKLTEATGKKDVDFGSITYGNPLAGTTTIASYTYNYTMATTGFTAAFPLSTGVMTTAIPAAALAPTITPVKNLVISNTVVAGADVWANAFVDTGVDPDGAGALPVTGAAAVSTNGQRTIKWDAQTGVSGYIVTVYDVDGGVPVTAAPIATIHTAQNSVMLPAAMFPAANQYVFKITTVKMAGVDFNTAPFTKAFPYEWADAISGRIQF